MSLKELSTNTLNLLYYIQFTNLLIVGIYIPTRITPSSVTGGMGTRKRE